MCKDFNDFIENIDSDTYETIKTAAKQGMLATHRSGYNDEAFFIALELLERYHNWVNA